MAKDSLTPRQEALARHYVANGCKDLAYCARAAGYKGSDKNLRNQTSKLLKRQAIADFVEQLKAQVAQRIDIRAIRIQAEVAALAFSNIADCVADDGSMKPLAEIPEHAQRAIAEYKVIETEAGVITSVKLHAKLPALQMLVALKGMDKPNDNRATEVALEFFGAKKTIEADA